jgi:hypothetical protein
MVEASLADAEFSPAGGGPFYRLMQSLPWKPGEDVLRTSLLLVAIGWLPLIAIALVDRIFTGTLDPIVLDPPIHVRLLIAIPLFLVAQAVLDERCRTATKRFVGGRYTDQTGVVRRLLDEVTHLRDATLPEAAILVLAMGAGQAVLWGATGSWGFLRSVDKGAAEALSLARVWYGVVALPLFLFLLFRVLWSWGLWSRVLWGFSRTDPHPIPTHPDHAGGLEHLAEPAAGFAVATLAGSTVVAATWANQILLAGANAQSFAASVVGLALLALLFALGPLLFFSRCLLSARIGGLREYSDLALQYTRLFHRRWLEESENRSVLGTPDIQSLADLGTSYENLSKMRVVLFGPRTAIMVVAAVCVPMVPLTMLKVPVQESLVRLGHALLGGLPR